MDVWTCCECRANNLIATAPEKCPLCSHSRCHRCTIGPPRASNPAPFRRSHVRHFPTASPGQAYPSSARSQQATLPSHLPSRSFYPTPPHQSHPALPPSIPPSIPPAPSLQRDPRREHVAGTLSNRPSMAGWWYCHGCKHLNNPALAAGRCTMCGHSKCYACRPA